MNMEEPIRILIVEDDERVEALRRTITETLGSVEILIVGFEGSSSAIREYSYEAVVLDLFAGDPANHDKQGQKTWEEIWERRKFVPIIVYTAGDCNLNPDVPTDNPLLKCIKKVAGSDKEVARHLLLARPHIVALRQVEHEFNEAIHSVIEKVCPLIWQATEADEQLRSDLLVRSARRRLAAMMDLSTVLTGEQMLSWEQYIYPPLEDSLLMGDILRTSDGVIENPTAYRLVLTPSCDMVKRHGDANVDHVLVAKCHNHDRFLKASGITIGAKRSDKISNTLSALLTQPQSGGYVLLPEYKSILPLMCACLRDLELIRLADIGTTDESSASFHRIVSVDSPFREQIAWAYLQITGRPGLPDRDLNRWIKDIFMASKQTSQS
jgi:CTP synthase